MAKGIVLTNCKIFMMKKNRFQEFGQSKQNGNKTRQALWKKGKS